MSDATQRKGMGAMPHVGGVVFRVWAPHAQRVSVIGSFNDWDGDTHPMHAETHGSWYADVAEAHVGDQYRFLLTTAQGAFTRIDPYARAVTTSVGNAIVHEPQEGYVIGFPAAGTWTLRFNSDRQGYSDDFAGHPSTNVVTEPGTHDGFPCHAALSIAPSSVLIFSP
jgi:1,4-alpha-glucan branching enzyme